MKTVSTETRAILMTADGKCILRGNSRSGYRLCLVKEKSRLPVASYKTKKGMQDFANSHSIVVSVEAAKAYKTNYVMYHESIYGPLEVLLSLVKYEV